MKEVFILIFFSIGLVSIGQVAYQKFLSELDKVNQGEGLNISLKYTVTRIFLAFLMFLSVYILFRVEIPTLHALMAYVLTIAFVNFVLGVYMSYLYVYLFDMKTK